MAIIYFSTSRYILAMQQYPVSNLKNVKERDGLDTLPERAVEKDRFTKTNQPNEGVTPIWRRRKKNPRVHWSRR